MSINGKIEIQFPNWNALLNPPSTKYLHYPESNIQCAGISGDVNDSIICSYNQGTNVLTLYDVVTGTTSEEI